MTTLSANYDPVFARVRLEISNATGSYVQIFRTSSADNSRVLVRSADPVRLVSGAGLVDDYEFPTMVTFTYQVYEDNVPGPALPMTVTDRTLWLKSPTNPLVNVPIRVAALGGLKRTRQRGVHTVLGRADPIVTAGVQSTVSGSLTLLTQSFEADQALGELLAESPTCYLVTPGARIGNETWISIGDITEEPLTRLLWEAGVKRTFEFTEVAPPIGSLVGDPTASYQAVLSTYATYSALRSGKATYQDILRGVGAVVPPPSPGAS